MGEQGADPPVDPQNARSAGPFCAVWIYSDTPDAFERAARFALQNLDYALQVVLIFSEAGVRLLQTDRLARLLQNPSTAELVDRLVEGGALMEIDIASARQAGFVETLGAALTLRVADPGRLAELTSGARISARY